MNAKLLPCALAGGLLLVLGCDGPMRPESATLQVTVVTAGAAPDGDGGLVRRLRGRPVDGNE